MKKEKLFSANTGSRFIRTESTVPYKLNLDSVKNNVPEGTYQQAADSIALPVNVLVYSSGLNVTLSVKGTEIFTNTPHRVHKAHASYEQLPSRTYSSTEWSLAYVNRINFNRTDKSGFGPINGSSKHGIWNVSQCTKWNFNIHSYAAVIFDGLINISAVQIKSRGTKGMPNPLKIGVFKGHKAIYTSFLKNILIIFAILGTF